MKKKINLSQIFRKLEDIDKKLIYQSSVNVYISERDAKKLLKRGTTWFWNQRQKGLPFFKLGGEVYYKKSDLTLLMKTN